MFVNQRESWTLAGATVACVTALYVPLVQRTVPGGDSGELITAAWELGVAHPPGYPLFTLLLRLAFLLLPGFSPAHSASLLTCLLGALASGTLCLTVCRLCGPGAGAVLAGGVLAVSRLSWQWAMVAEVFTLNNLFIGVLFALTASFHCADSAPQRRRLSQWGALCCGLGLCNQHTLLLYEVVIIPWVLLRLLSLRELCGRGLLSLGACFLTGLLPYLYLPLSSYLNTARWSWGDQRTLRGLLTHLLRREYGTFSLAKSEGNTDFSAMLQAQWDHSLADLSVPVLVMCGLALLLCSLERGRRAVPWLLCSMLLLYSLFFSWRANLDIKRPLLLGVVERFWIQSDAAVCVLAGLGLSWTQAWLERRLGYGAVWRAAGWLFTLALLASMALNNYRECDQSSNSVVEKFGQELLSSVPQNSIILTRGDLPGNSLRYLHYCQGERSDLALVDQEMMTYDWYVSRLGQHLSGVRFPGLRWDPAQTQDQNTFSLEHFLSQNTQRAMFACIGLPEGDPSWERSFSRWPLGVCDQLLPAHTHFHPDEWVRHTQDLYHWSEPHDSFPVGSWERVANEEMWQARMKTAFFLFDLAERMEGEGKAWLFQLSHTLYSALVETHSPSYPPNWDKNLALACERVLRWARGEHSAEALLTCSITHFSLYLQREPSDPQADAIRSTIAMLQREKARISHTP